MDVSRPFNAGPFLFIMFYSTVDCWSFYLLSSHCWRHLQLWRLSQMESYVR